MESIDYNRHSLKLEALCAHRRAQEIHRFSQRIRVFHYVAARECLAPHGGVLSLKMAVRGSELFTMRGLRLRLNPGEALLMPPGIEYGSEIVAPTESFSAFFPRAFLDGLLASRHGDLLGFGEHRRATSLPPLPVAVDSRCRDVLLGARLHLMAQRWDRAEELLQEAVQHLIMTTEELHRADARLAMARWGHRREMLRRLQRARACIHDNMVKGVSLQELADVCQISRFHLLRCFRQAFGRTPAQYLSDLRLQRAEALLRQQKWAVSEVARAVGYRSHSAFSRAWRQRYGGPPTSTVGD